MGLSVALGCLLTAMPCGAQSESPAAGSVPVTASEVPEATPAPEAESASGAGDEAQAAEDLGLPELPAEPAPLEEMAETDAGADADSAADPATTADAHADQAPGLDAAPGPEGSPPPPVPTAVEASANGPRYEISSLAFPTPPELFRSLSKAGTTRWRQLYRPPFPDLGTDRHRAALGLGTVFADLYLAAEASDVQHLRNTGQDVVTLGRGLGVGEHLSPVMHELGVMAENQEWNGVRMRLQRSLEELTDRLRTQRDDDLVILIDLGLWLRVLEISAQAVIEDEEFALKELCVGSVAILMTLRDRHGELSEGVREDETVNEIGLELIRLAWRWDGRSGTAPSRDDVEASYVKIRNLLRRLLQRA